MFVCLALSLYLHPLIHLSLGTAPIGLHSYIDRCRLELEKSILESQSVDPHKGQTDNLPSPLSL